MNLDEALHLRRSNAAFLSVDNAAIGRAGAHHLLSCHGARGGALAYIRAHAAEGATTTDVVRHLGVSRRLAELRFRELRGGTIRAAIEKERLDQVKRLLRTTTRPIGRIADETGFGSADCLSRLFRQRTGKSPRAWRAQHAQ